MKKDEQQVCLCRIFAPYGPESAYIGQIGDCPIHSPKKHHSLINFTTKYFFIAFITAGLFYFAWHFGRAYEKAHDPDITFAECKPTDDPDKLDCVLYEVEPGIAKIWKAIIAEMNNPTTKEQLEKEYEAWEQKVGL